MTTDSPDRRPDTAIGSPAFEAAKEAAQSRGWVMEPSVISAMLAAAFGPLLERLDQQAAEIERLRNALVADAVFEDLWQEAEVERDAAREQSSNLAAALAAAQARVEAVEALDKEHARQLCEAMGEQYEPQNRDEWERSFAEMLPHVKARSDMWRLLLERIEQIDPDWLNEQRVRLAGDAARPLPEPERPLRHQPSSSFGYAYCAVCRADWPCHAAKEQAGV